MGWRKGKSFTSYIVKCEVCGIAFKTVPTSSKQKTCSRKCAFEKVKKNRLQSKCQICQKLILSPKSRVKKFCSNTCRHEVLKSLAKQRSITRSTWGQWKNRKSAKLWFVTTYNGCMKCGYNSVPEILELHHIDRNDKNNNKNNLMLLCPNCHSEDHWEKRDGQFANNKGRHATQS